MNALRYGAIAPTRFIRNSAALVFCRFILTLVFMLTLLFPKEVNAQQNIFYPAHIKVIEGHNLIKELPDDIVWMTGNGCNVSEERTDFDLYPLAVPGTANFRLEVRMNRCPYGADLRFLEGMIVNWDYERWGVAGRLTLERGAGGEFWYVNLPSPSVVGIDTLNLKFDMGCCDNAPSFELRRKVLVTKHPNKASTYAIDVPLRAWYEKATLWADGTEDEDEVLEKLLSGVFAYGSNWQYDGSNDCKWHQLIEDGGICKRGECFTFTDVFDNMARVLGIDGLQQVKVYSKGGFTKGYPFVTKAGLVSLDPNFKGNARLLFNGPDFDRYVFLAHSLVLRNSKYYDATFNNIQTGTHDFIEYNANGTNLYWWESDFTAVSYYTTLEGPRIYPLNSSPGGYLSRWGTYDVDLSPQKRDGEAFFDVAGMSSAPIAFNEVVFRTETIGTLNTTILVDVEFEVFEAGVYNIAGALTKDESLISVLPHLDAVIPSSQFFDGDPGVYTIQLQFSGEDVYQSAMDGPYVLHLSAGGVADTFATPAYTHVDFGEVAATFTDLTEMAMDQDGNGALDGLQVSNALSVRAAGNYVLQTALLEGSRTIATVSQTVALVPGDQTVTTMIPGDVIHDTYGSSAFEIVSNLLDESGGRVGNISTTTDTYDSAGFGSFLTIAGGITDEGYDREGDGLLDELQIVFDATVDSTGSYTFSGVLHDPDGEAFAYASKKISMTAGVPARIALGFSYLQLNAREKDGTFTIHDVHLLDSQGRTLNSVSLNHTTNTYAYMDFEPAFTLTFADALAEQLTDTDNDGLTDTLTVLLDVTSTRDGVLQVNGDLYGVDGKRVARGSGSVAVSAGVPAAMPLAFDGRYLYGSLQADRFSLRNVSVYPTSDFSQVTQVDTPLETTLYDHETFEPSAVITGVVQDPGAVGAFATGAFVYSPGASDTADSGGKFRLVFLDGGVRNVLVSYSGQSGAVWQVYVDDAYIGDQSSAVVTTTIGEVRRVDFRSWDPLPVVLTSVVALADGATVYLAWQTQSETNNAGFEVQHQGSTGLVDAPRSWQAAAFVRGGGTTELPSSYSFPFRNLAAGVHRFRLKQVDFDGRFTYSEEVEATVVLAVSHRATPPYPNPFNPTTQFTLEVGQSQEVTIQVYDPLGRLVSRIYRGMLPAGAAHVFTFDAHDQASGLYLIRIEGAQFSEVLRVMLLE